MPCKLNGILLAPKRPTNREKWSNCGKVTSMPLRWRVRSARAPLLLMLLALAISVTACATKGTPSDYMPRNPSPPPLSQSPPTQTYSSSASENIAAWRKLLIELLRMP